MVKRFTLGVLSITFLLGLAVLYGAYQVPCSDFDFNLIFRYDVGARAPPPGPGHKNSAEHSPIKEDTEKYIEIRKNKPLKRIHDLSHKKET